MITVGIDIRELRVGKTGTRATLEEIVSRVSAYRGATFRFVLLDTPLPVFPGRNIFLKTLEHFRFLFWKQVQLPLLARWKACDIVFCNDYFCPLWQPGFQTVPVFHDAFFFEFPEQMAGWWLWLFKRTAVPAARKSPVVFTQTAFSKQRLLNHTGLRDEQLRVIYIGPKSFPAGGEHPQFTDPLLSGLERHKFILHVGVKEKRKNLPLLVSAFARLKAEHPSLKLVLAGPVPKSIKLDDSAAIQTAIRENGLTSGDVLLPGFLPGNDIATLYRNALLYVFPSIYEGFGMPVTEAMHFGCPVIVANNTCLPEIGGDAVLTFDPRRADQLLNRMQQVIADPALRASMVKKGHERVRFFSWDKTIENMLREFEKLVPEHPAR